MIEPDEIDERGFSIEAHSIAVKSVIRELIAVVFATFPSSDSVEHRAAMRVVLEFDHRAKAALAKPTLN
jgi:hypothetical protein